MTSTKIIPSGEFYIGPCKQEILEAHLGTCVGVTLVDRAHGIGGLAHFLLPEPIGTDPGWKPACYAASGAPHFLRSFLEAGGAKANLEAVMAGGALLGPVSQTDLSLDIGGRTSEWLSAFFERESIPLRQQETGGFYTCRLRLNLLDLDSRVDQMDATADYSPVRHPALTWAAIDQRIERLRPIPQVVLKLIREINSEKYDLQETVRALQQDQVLTAQILKLCNSPAFPMVRRIDTLPHAAALLGGINLRRLIVASAMNLVYEKTGKGYSLCKGGLFQHAISTAQAAHRLALFTRSANADLAGTAGLLHDIGKVVLDQHLARAHPFFYRSMQIDARELCALESSQFGVNHTETGERLAIKWDLPPNLTAVVRYHHSPEDAGEHAPLVALIHLADLIISRFHVGYEIERISADHLGERLKILGLSLDQLPQLAEVAFHPVADECGAPGAWETAEPKVHKY